MNTWRKTKWGKLRTRAGMAISAMRVAIEDKPGHAEACREMLSGLMNIEAR